MIIVDTALNKRESEGNPVRVAVVGAGYIGRGTTLQIEKYLPGMRVVVISNRTLSQAARAYQEAGIDSFNTVETVSQLEDSIAKGQYAITDNALLLCEADGAEVIIEATGDVEFSSHVAMKAIEHKNIWC